MKKVILFLIKIYKKVISPMGEYMGVHCKYYPTCSEYTKEAIEKYGAIQRIVHGH